MNGGDLGLSNLSAAMISSDPFVSLLYNTTASYPSIGGGVSAENTRDWDTRISPDAPDGHEFEFVLRFTAAEGGPWDVAVAVPIGCGPTPDPGGGGEAAFVSYRVDDGPGHDGTGNDSKGNDDGLPQCGETIELYATLSNVGDDALSGLSALLVESDPYVALLYNSTAAFPDLAAGASRENRLDWDLAISTGGYPCRIVTRSHVRRPTMPCTVAALRGPFPTYTLSTHSTTDCGETQGLFCITRMVQCAVAGPSRRIDG